MNVSLLYFEGCPSWHEADDRLRQALDTTGHVDTPINYVLVSTPEEAERLQFRGSPTVLVDDVDPFADLNNAEPNNAVGLACRLYRTEDGGRAGSPTLEQLISALS
ncbi:MAG: thioredoxin family protein [Phycicoccus sp.]|nr:thioredoxin family protein [Phycicoccus sp.]NMM35800.1 thioredoxin family protein [Phycicoccus sp.]